MVLTFLFPSCIHICYSVPDQVQLGLRYIPPNVHSVEQKSFGLLFRTSRSGSHVTYICHHNSSRFISPYLRIRGVPLSSIHGWKRRTGNYQKMKTEMAVTIQSLTLRWVEAESLYKTNTVISRICGVSCKGQCRKPGLSSLPEIAMSYGPLYRFIVTFDHWLSPWHDKWNQ